MHRLEKRTTQTLGKIGAQGLTIALIFLASGCAMKIVEVAPTEDQLIQGRQLIGKPIPDGKVLFEFTTNSSTPVSLFQTSNEPNCKLGEGQPIGTATKPYDPTKPEKGDDIDGNVRYLKGTGLGSFVTQTISPARVLFYAQANVESTYSSSFNFTTGNGSSLKTRSCGPFYSRFSPRSGGHYRYTFVGQGNTCRMILQEIAPHTGSEPLRHTSWHCDKDGKSEVRHMLPVERVNE